MRGCFAENRHVVFFWKLPGERARDGMLDRMLARTHDVWKESKKDSQTVMEAELGLFIVLSLQRL